MHYPTPLGEITSTLRRGSRGQEVFELQQRLKELNYYEGALDGQFGPATHDAVTLFQEVYNLSPDGVVGPKTRSVLASAKAGETVVVGPDGSTKFINKGAPEFLANISNKLKVPIPLLFTAIGVLGLVGFMFMIKKDGGAELVANPLRFKKGPRG